MATYLNKLGVIKWFSGSLETTIGGFGVSGMMAGLLLVLAYMYAHYFFASTTAHITAMFGAFWGSHFFGFATHAHGFDVCGCVQPDDEFDPLRHRHIARCVWFGLHHHG